MKWRLRLLEYEYEIIYKTGKTNLNADALSRNPVVPNILPIIQEDSSDSDTDSIFSPIPRTFSKDLDPGEDTSKNDIPHNDIDAPQNNETNADDTTDSEISNCETLSSDGSIFDQTIEPCRPREHFNNITSTKRPFCSAKETPAVFVDTNGKPYCDTALLPFEIENLPTFDEAEAGRALILKIKTRTVIFLPVETRVSNLTSIETLGCVLKTLKEICRQRNINAVALCKGTMGQLSWETIENTITSTLNHMQTHFQLYLNELITPPVEDRKIILEEIHSSTINGHKGVTKTYNRVKEKYYWPKLKLEIQSLIRNCRDCQLKKLVRVKTKQPMVITDTPRAAFEKISIDIMGPLPTTRSGNVYILTIQDLLTKYSLAIPLKNAAAIDVADAFVHHFICIFGSPKALLTDQGTHFINSLIKQIAKKFKIQTYRTTAYRPQSNGSIERSHHVLWEFLKQYVNKGTEWDQLLALATFSYNTSVHEGTLYTPHELVFGKTAELPSSYIPIPHSITETYADYLASLFNRLDTVLLNARNNLIKAKHRSKQYYDKQCKPCPFNIGDSVYLLKEPARGKLGDQYVGPFIVVKNLPNQNVQIDLGNNRTRLVHKDKLKINKGDPSAYHLQPLP